MKLTAFLSIALCSAVIAKDKPEDTEIWQPVPPIVNTSAPSGVPSDAIVLFDGSGLQSWVGEKSPQPTWTVADGILTIKPKSGGIVTKQGFEDCQLHIEWRSPEKVQGDSQNRGNSGIFFQGRYEIQILDSFQNPTYVNGQAASLYKQQAPLVNASRGPGQWQVYDIVFRAPRFNPDGSLRQPGYVTVLHNGVLVQDHTAIQGGTVYIGKPVYTAYPPKQPLLLQEHGCPVSFRNIWIRELKETDTAPTTKQ
jgi:hypothetical protein